MPRGIVYMPQSGQQAGAGAASTGSASNFRKPTLQDGVGDAKLKDAGYAQRITDARKKAQEQNAKIYGESLGNMYDGHRDALQKYRDHLSSKWNKGDYYFSPEQFNQDLAKFQSYVDQAEKYYMESYGDPSTADGKGFTMADINLRGTNGNANEFYEENGYELKDKDGNPIDEFDWGQERYDFINSGGFDPNTLEINENGEMVAKGADGQTMDIFQMAHIMDGARTFMPDTRAIATQTLYDYARTDEYQDAAKITQDAINNAAPGSKVTFHDPTDPNADENGNVTKLAGELTAEQKEMYISDQHWDSAIGTNKFRRRVVDDLFPELSDQDRQTFIETGEIPGNDENSKNLRMEEARRKWREVSRLSTTQQKSGSGDGSEFQFSDKVVMGGYAVPVGQDVNPTNTGSGFGPSEPYNINRFNTPIKMKSGLATTSGNTQQMVSAGFDKDGNEKFKIQTIAGPSDDGSYSINGAGYSPDGRLVVTVSTVVTEMVPEFGYNDRGEPRGQMVAEERTVVKPIYLTDIHGEPPADGTQELELYNTVTQNPDMGPILQFQRAQRSQSLLNDLAQQNPNAGSGPGVYVEGTDNETMDRNVNIGATIMEGLPEDVQQEVRQVQDRVLRETDREQVILPRVEDGQVIFFDKQGRRRTDLDPIPLTSAGPAQRGAAAPASLQSRSTQQNQPQDQRGIQGSTRELGDVPQSEAPTSEERRTARRENREDRVEPLQSRRADRIPTEERDIIRGRAASGEMPRAEAPTAEEVEEARREVTQEEDRAFWSDVREKTGGGENFWGTRFANDETPFSGDGVNTITDEKSLGKAIEEFGNPPTNSPYYDIAKEKGLLRGLTDEDIREMYRTRVASQEGYRADGIVINVPAIGKSGVTIAGLDIGNAAGGSDVKIDIIAKYVDDPKQIEALRTLKGLERDEADAALKKLQEQGLLTREALGLTQDDLNNITADYGERSYKDFVRKVGSEKELRNLPPDVVEGMLDVHFNVPGGTTEGPGNPLPELARVLKKKPIKKEDVEKLAEKYDNYWGTEEQVAERLQNDSLSESNVRRTAEAARRLREFGAQLS